MQDNARKPWLVLALLSAAMVVSYIDRFVLSMLIQPIKLELSLSDTQIGLITGLAFSLFYAVFGVLIARLADRRGARVVVIGSLFTWSLMTALCGAAQNFLQLLIARFGVGAGEAGLTPAGHATLARLFPPHRRNLALALLSAAGPVGIMIALLSSGYLEARFGWRWTFVVMALPGLLLAGVFIAVRQLLPGALPKIDCLPMKPGIQVAVTALRNRSFVCLTLLMSGLIFLGMGQAQWIPAYFERQFGLARSELGVMLALTQGVGMVAGSTFGGWLADHLMARKPEWRLYLIVGALSVCAPLLTAVYFVADALASAALIGIGIFVAGLPTGALWASIQDVSDDTERATHSGLAMMIGFVLGLGIGPFVIGGVSDFMVPLYGGQSLRVALIVTSIGAALMLVWPIFRLLKSPIVVLR